MDFPLLTPYSMFCIFITIPSMDVVGGIERVTSFQANYWAGKGYDVYIITYTNTKENSFYSLLPQVKILNIKVDDSLLSPKFNPLDKIRLISAYKKGFRNLCDKYNPHIVFTTMHGIETYFLKYICKPIPVVGINHVSLSMQRGVYAHGFNRFLNFFRCAYKTRQQKKMDCIIALARTDEVWFKEMKCNVTYIPNPVLLQKTERSIERQNLVICVGRLDYLKGQDRLIDIWRDVHSDFPDWKLMLVGDGRSRNELEKRAREYGCAQSVVFTGNREDVSSLLSQSSIFVFASRTEGFGMVLLEAFVHGLPVVSYDCDTGPRDIVHSYYNGFLIKNGDMLSFVQKLAMLMRDKELRECYARNAQEYVRRFDVNRIMPMYDDLMNSICKKHIQNE